MVNLKDFPILLRHFNLFRNPIDESFIDMIQYAYENHL